MTGGCRPWFVVFCMTFLMSGCYYQGFRTPDELTIGLYPTLARDEGSVRVLLIHGIGCHRTGWSDDLQASIATQLDMTEVDYAANSDPTLRRLLLELEVADGRVTPVSSYFEPEAFPLATFARPCTDRGQGGPAGRGVTDDDHPTLLVRHYVGAGGHRLSFYEVTWSPIAERRKQRSILAADEDPSTNGDGRSARPAVLNRRLKSELIDRRLSDAVLYLGAERENILALVRDAMCRTWRSAVSAAPCNPRDPRLVDGMQHHRYSIIAASLGSRIAFDVLASQELSGVVEKMLQRTDAIYMLANQLPLLELAGRAVDGPIAEASDPLGDEFRTRLSHLLDTGIACPDGEAECEVLDDAKDGLLAALSEQRKRLTDEAQLRLYDAVAERDELDAKAEHLDAVARYQEKDELLTKVAGEAEDLQAVDLPRQQARLEKAGARLEEASADLDGAEGLLRSHLAGEAPLERQRSALEARREKTRELSRALVREQWSGVNSVAQCMTDLSRALTLLQERRYKLLHSELKDEVDADLRRLPQAAATAASGQRALAWFDEVWTERVNGLGSRPQVTHLAHKAFADQERLRRQADERLGGAGESVACGGFLGFFGGCSKDELEGRRDEVREAAREVLEKRRRCCGEIQDAAFTQNALLPRSRLEEHCAGSSGGETTASSPSWPQRMKTAREEERELDGLLEDQEKAWQRWDDTRRSLQDLRSKARRRRDDAKAAAEDAEKTIRDTKATLRELQRRVMELTEQLEELAADVARAEQRYLAAVEVRQALARLRPAGIAAFDRLMLTSLSALLRAQIDSLDELESEIGGDAGRRQGLMPVLDAVVQDLKSLSRERSLQIVAIGDSNDLLSYSLSRNFEEQLQFVDFINVPVQLAPEFLGLWANPVEAHSGHNRNRNVIRLVSCGTVRDEDGAVRLGDCVASDAEQTTAPSNPDTKEERAP